MGQSREIPVLNSYINAYGPRSHYWRTRRGVSILFCLLLSSLFLVNSLRASQSRPQVTSAFSNGIPPPKIQRPGNSGAVGSFGGWRGWRKPWGPYASTNKGTGEKIAVNSPLPTGLSDFSHPKIEPSEAERRKKMQEEEKKAEDEKAQKLKKLNDALDKPDTEKEKQEAERKKAEEEERRQRETLNKNPNGLTTTVVVGHLKKEVDTVQWINNLLRDVTHRKMYVVDDPNADLHLNQNKGREAMVYIKYILDYYDKLDDVTIFHHANRTAWHNNVLLNRDGAVMINNLNRQRVIEKGYVNTRCELHPGCPQWIKWNASKAETLIHYERSSDTFTEKLWDRLFPNRTHNPVFLSQPCCSQFAVSKDKIRSIPRQQYQIIHDWLADTALFDGYTGRIMEYTWQYLFLDEDEHCPDMQECYCKTYGVCIDGKHLKDLQTYNELRSEIDDTLDKLSKWDNSKCADMKDPKAKGLCKLGNPWNDPLGKIRARKMNLESSMPREWGIMEP